MTRAGTIPLSEIGRIEIYENTKKYRQHSLAKLLKETGGDFLFNGTIFSWSTYKPLCHCKASGKILCKPNYNVWGMNLGTQIAEAIIPNDADTYIACVPLIVQGKKIAKPNYQPDMGGARARTVIGMKEGRFAYYVTSEKRTPEWLRDYLHSVGWSHATMLDGGGSTCFWDADNKGFMCDPARMVQHFIVVHLKKEHDEKQDTTGIRAYSKSLQGGENLSQNFTVAEFACRDGTDPVFVAPKLVEILQQIRTHFGRPVRINSAYRTPAYNAKVGGAKYSQHCYGTAADITISGVAPSTVAAYVETLMPAYGGIGIYTKQGFTHVDVRTKKARWHD